MIFGKIILCVKKSTPNFIIYTSNLVIMAESVQQKNLKQLLIEQSTTAVYAIFRKARLHSLAVNIQLKLVHSLVLPILLYCCEICVFEKSTPNFMIYGELDRFPLKYKAHSRIIIYRKRTIESKEQNLSVII